MPEVSFYLLSSNLPRERDDFTCKLIEKIYRNGRTCFVLTDNMEQATHFDKHLWSFRAGSFVPHQIFTGALPKLNQTILIGHSPIPESRTNLIINLSANLPVVSEHTERILEILDNSEACKGAGRQRYRHYRQIGLTINTHNIH